jgi:hypothetical protein
VVVVVVVKFFDTVLNGVCAGNGLSTSADWVVHEWVVRCVCAPHTNRVPCLSSPPQHFQVDLPAPALLKPQELWTGKQLWSVLVRPNANTR